MLSALDQTLPWLVAVVLASEVVAVEPVGGEANSDFDGSPALRSTIFDQFDRSHPSSSEPQELKE